MSLYPWSSYDSVVSNKPTKLKRSEVIDLYGTKSDFLDYHNTNQNLDEIKQFMIE
jgi:hypothetical protein